MLKFQNPACYILLALCAAHCVNDPLSIPIIGGVPITPVQITIVISIIYLITRNKRLGSIALKKVFLPAYIYFVVIVISTVLTFIEFRQLELYALTLGFNLLLLRALAPYLYLGFSRADVRRLMLSLIYLFTFLVLLPGIYEFSTRTNILSTQKGLSSNIFYIRALFTDKIEFGTVLALLVFILILVLENLSRTFSRLVVISLILLSLTMIFFSFSTTAIVGIVAGVTVLFLYNVRGIFIKSFAAVFFIFGLYSFFSDTPLFEEQVKSYRLKYSLNIDRYDEKNFRYLSFVKGFDSFVENPFFGSGVSQSQVVVQQLLGTRKQVNPHNILITELIDYGLFGTVFLGIFLYRLYRLMFRKFFNYNSIPHLYFLQRFSVALGIFVLFRLTLYYHRFDQTIYFLWAAIVMATFGTAIATYRAAQTKTLSHAVESSDSGTEA